MKRFPFQPEPVDVVVSEGRPSRVIFKKRPQRVEKITNLWRVDDRWWSKPVARLYYTLELDGGHRITVFYDLSDKKWYRQHWTA